MTSGIPVQSYTLYHLSYQENWEVIILWVSNEPIEDVDTTNLRAESLSVFQDTSGRGKKTLPPGSTFFDLRLIQRNG